MCVICLCLCIPMPCPSPCVWRGAVWVSFDQITAKGGKQGALVYLRQTFDHVNTSPRTAGGLFQCLQASTIPRFLPSLGRVCVYGRAYRYFRLSCENAEEIKHTGAIESIRVKTVSTGNKRPAVSGYSAWRASGDLRHAQTHALNICDSPDDEAR